MLRAEVVHVSAYGPGGTLTLQTRPGQTFSYQKEKLDENIAVRFRVCLEKLEKMGFGLKETRREFKLRREYAA